MNLGFLTNEFVTQDAIPGGLGYSLHRLCKALAQRGHEIHVVTYGEKTSEKNFDNIHVHTLSSAAWRKRINLLFLGRDTLSALYLDFSWQAFLKFKQLHSRCPFDVIQSANLFGMGIFPLLFLKVPQVVRISGYMPASNVYLNNYGINYTLLEWLENQQIKRARYLYSPSQFMKNLIEQSLSCSPIDVFPTSFDLEDIDLDESFCKECLNDHPFLLFFSGNLSTLKGAHILAEALPSILKKYPSLQMVWIGRDVPFEGKSMRKYIQDRMPFCQNRNHFYDPLPQSKLFPMIQKARTVVFPTFIENFPNSCLEALSLGALVLGSSETSIEEMIQNGENGFLFPKGDVEKLRESLLHVLEIQDTSILRKNAKNSTKRFSSKEWIPKVENYFENVVHNSQCASL